MERLKIRILGNFAWCLPVVLLLATALRAGETPPAAGPGATRDEVIAAYGWPNGMSRTGAREIFTYAQGRVTLVDGRVEAVDFSPKATWQTPKPRPPEPTASKPRPPAQNAYKMPPVDYWGTDFAEAVREATARRVRIIALFSGSDWSPVSKRFHDEIELQPEFVDAVLRDFVLLRLDFPVHASQPPALREQNVRLRVRFGVTIYPSVLILSSAGERIASVDLAKISPALPYREQVVAAIKEVHKLLTTPRALPRASVDVAEMAVQSAAAHGSYYLMPGVTVLLLALWLMLRRRSLAEGAVAPAETERGLRRHL